VARTPEVLIHDLDGNLVRDGRWMYYWYAENRLTRVMSVAGPSSSFRRVEWKYDAWGRRIRQKSYVLSNGVWQVVEDLKFVSDPGLFGRHVAELKATDNSLGRAYVWGLDLSETLDGAGGVGGLLWMRIASGPAAGTHFACYDGNGNVWNLVSASTGTETARYEYGPFGEPLRLSGPAARSNPLRFSTKRTEDLRGLVLYEYRAYSPSSGRWLSMDPILDLGFSAVHGKIKALVERADVLAAYCFVRNAGHNGLNVLGTLGNLLCECLYSPPDVGFPSSKKNVLIADSGREECTRSRLGDVVVVTHKGIVCDNRILVPRKCIDCRKRECAVRSRYRCGYWRGSLHWLFLDWTYVKKCP